MGKFKIAKVLKADKHPNADKLKVCDVTIGGKILKLFASTKIREGLITIYAPPGAVIPKTTANLVAKIRGESKGMFALKVNLIFNDSDGIIELKNKDKEIESYFKKKPEKGQDINYTKRADCL